MLLAIDTVCVGAVADIKYKEETVCGGLGAPRLGGMAQFILHHLTKWEGIASSLPCSCYSTTVARKEELYVRSALLVGWCGGLKSIVLAHEN